MLNQFQLINKSLDKTITIKGVKLSYGISISRDYNLSILNHTSYLVKATGYYNKNKPILEVLDWIKSTEGHEHIRKLYSKTENVIYLANRKPLIIYTSSRYVWLGYLKHCIGNIDAAIKAELIC